MFVAENARSRAFNLYICMDVSAYTWLESCLGVARPGGLLVVSKTYTTQGIAEFLMMLAMLLFLAIVVMVA